MRFSKLCFEHICQGKHIHRLITKGEGCPPLYFLSLMFTACESTLTQIEPGIYLLRYLTTEKSVLLSRCTDCPQPECRFTCSRFDELIGKVLIVDMTHAVDPKSILWHRVFSVAKRASKTILFGAPPLATQVLVILGGNKIMKLVKTEEEAFVLARRALIE